MFALETNANAFAIELMQMAEAIPEQQEAALTRLAIVVKQDVEREIQETYSRRVPGVGEYYRVKTKHRSGTDLGKPAWVRKANSGGLIASVVIVEGPLTRTITIGGEAAKYAPGLAELPDGPDGVNRSNNFSERAVQKHEQQWGEIYEQDLFNLLDL